MAVHGNFGAFWGKSYNFKAMKNMLDTKMREAGVKILFHTYFSNVIIEDNRVVGVVVQNKGGRMAFKAKYVIDATGDGDVAVAAGAEYIYGNEKDGFAQAMTTMFLISNPKFRQSKPDELYELMKKGL